MRKGSQISEEQHQISQAKRSKSGVRRLADERLQKFNDISFCKTMTSSMVTNSSAIAYRLEIPAPFIRANANKFQELITLETPDNCNHLWPVAVTIRPWGDRPRVMFDGHDGGWKKFVVENKVRIGDTVIFKLVAMSRFVVEIHPAKHSSEACCSSNYNTCTTYDPPPAASFGGKRLKWRKRDVLDILLDPFDDQNDQMDNNIMWNFQAPERSQFSSRGIRERSHHVIPPQKRKRVYDDSSLPHFIKTLCVSHMERNGCASSARMDIPVAFMRCYHKEMYTIVRLKGPNSKVVKIKLFKSRYYRKNTFRFYFGTGWRAFCDSNNLRVGDRVRFSLEEPSHFVVDRVLNYHKLLMSKCNNLSRETRTLSPIQGGPMKKPNPWS